MVSLPLASLPLLCNHPRMNDSPGDEKKFRGWRLLAVIMSVVVLLAVISFVIDWIVIGPLEGRVF